MKPTSKNNYFERIVRFIFFITGGKTKKRENK